MKYTATRHLRQANLIGAKIAAARLDAIRSRPETEARIERFIASVRRYHEHNERMCNEIDALKGNRK